MSISIDDIAREAGVSTATVSRVINKSPRVRSQTAAKVEAVMRKHNYLPNGIARSLASKTSKTIGIIVASITNPAYAEMIRSIQDEAEKYGYVTIVCNSDENMQKEREYIDMLLEKQVAGVIFPGGRGIGEKYNGHVIELSKKVPVVLANEFLAGSNIYSIICDKRKGAYDMIRHFLALGHREIAMVTGYSNYNPSIEKYEGYREALEECGIAVRDDLVIYSDYLMPGGYKAALTLMKLKVPPTAILTANDLMAIGCMRALQKHGVRVPQDIAVAGYDDIKINRYFHPAITSVSQDINEIARLSAKTLISVLNKEPNVPSKQVLQPVLQIRESCGSKLKLRNKALSRHV
jgi:LacI family transcriptional regulator